jgi:hypothetical protein
MVALNVDRNGTVRWTRGYGGSFDDRGWSASSSDDGGFLFGADRYLAASLQYMSVLKTGWDGRAGNDCAMDQARTYSVAYDGLPLLNVVPATAAGTYSLTQPTLTVRSNSIETSLDCSASDKPGEVGQTGTDSFRFSDRATALWGDTESRYDVYRGALDGLQVGDYGACVLSDSPANLLVDPDDPAIGRGFAYLVAGRNAIARGSLGHASSGAERTVVLPCP